MSAADTFAKFGTGARNLAIGAGVLIAIVAVVYLVKKFKAGADAAIGAVSDAGGFLFGSDTAPQTLGTWLYDATHPEAPATLDEAQAIKSCNLIWKQKGNVTSSICQGLRDAGKLTAP
jgi:hypothetical protein